MTNEVDSLQILARLLRFPLHPFNTRAELPIVTFFPGIILSLHQKYGSTFVFHFFFPLQEVKVGGAALSRANTVHIRHHEKEKNTAVYQVICERRLMLKYV